MLKFSFAAAPLILFSVLANATSEQRQAHCPRLHVFGARESTLSGGFGSAGMIVDRIVQRHPGATASPIDYPARGGTNDEYSASVRAGTAAVVNQVQMMAYRCPQTRLVLVGHSQGAHVIDNAVCGGGDPNQHLASSFAFLNDLAFQKVSAVLLFGDPRNVPGAHWHVGDAKQPGFDPRPPNFNCLNRGSKLQSYCDASDPICSQGNYFPTHQSYERRFIDAADAFVRRQLGW